MKTPQINRHLPPPTAATKTRKGKQCEKACLKSLTNTRHSKPPLFFIKNLVASDVAGVVFHVAYKNHSGNRISGGKVAVELEAAMVEVVVEAGGGRDCFLLKLMQMKISLQSGMLIDSEVAMDIDLPVEVGPTTEETVDALLEYFVGPLVPLKHFEIASETPSEIQQESVAKQVHAAAVLYNYFHLNHHKESQFLKFGHLNPNLDDPENQLSLTEKANMDACTMSKKAMINHDEEREGGLQKLAFLAVEEATGNVNGELKVLESHVVYSLSQANTATLFYIVQSTCSIGKDDLVPIQDAICRWILPLVIET
ncbi:hypothetical protein R6Q57_006934 [Mikania cordata]